MSNPPNKGPLKWTLILVFAMGLWALQYPFGKMLGENINPFLLSELRFFFASLALLPIFIFTKHQNKITKQDYLKLIGLGLLLATNSSLVFMGINLASPIFASIIVNTNPLWIALLAPLLIQEKFTLRKTFAVILGIAGITVAITNGRPLSQLITSESIHGILILLCAAITIALYTIASKPIVQKYGSIRMNFLIMLSASITFIPIIIANKSITQITTFTPPEWIISVLMGAVATAIPYTLWKKSLDHLEATIAGSFKLLIPIFATIYSVVAFNEPVTSHIIIGILLTSIAIIQVQRKNKSLSEEPLNT